MGKFKKGQSGNPRGRPKGIVDRRSQYRSLIEQHIPDVLNQVVSAAISGDMTACKLLLDRVLPSFRTMAPAISLRDPGEPVANQSKAVVKAMLCGSLAPDQAAAAMSVLADHARLCEHAELQARLEALEAQYNESPV